MLESADLPLATDSFLMFNLSKKNILLKLHACVLSIVLVYELPLKEKHVIFRHGK